MVSPGSSGLGVAQSTGGPFAPDGHGQGKGMGGGGAASALAGSPVCQLAVPAVMRSHSEGRAGYAREPWTGDEKPALLGSSLGQPGAGVLEAGSGEAAGTEV